MILKQPWINTNCAINMCDPTNKCLRLVKTVTNKLFDFFVLIRMSTKLYVNVDDITWLASRSFIKGTNVLLVFKVTVS